ncbi:hypothetical protein BC832DRAFT_12584 [Gaertneriomyces semiglobifer]|nr:hypothetical protein BC832DRAFT_12584 [Gaertneriomyces semiglobifer]
MNPESAESAQEGERRILVTRTTVPMAFHEFGTSLTGAISLVLLLFRKGTRLHRNLGRAWVATMTTTILGTAFITELRRPKMLDTDYYALGSGESDMKEWKSAWSPKYFSEMHLLGLCTLGAMYGGIRAIRRGQKWRHGFYMSAAISTVFLGHAVVDLYSGHQYRRHNVIGYPYEDMKIDRS